MAFTMYTIGAFAALGRVSVRMLRHYDGIGLLVPAHVDDRTGYRFYAIEQLPLLLRIAELRDLGVGLDSIAVVTAADDNAAMRSALAERRRELERSVDDDRERIARIDRRLRQLEGVTMSNVTYKSLEPVTVYAAKGIAEGMGPEFVGPVVGPLIEQLNQALTAAGRPLIEPGIFWYDEAEGERLAVHVSYVAEPEPVAGDGYEVIELAKVPIAATILHHGDLSTLGETWAQLVEQTVADGYRMVGASREVYLEAEGHVPGPDWVTELQVPVERV